MAVPSVLTVCVHLCVPDKGGLPPDCISFTSPAQSTQLPSIKIRDAHTTFQLTKSWRCLI